MACEQLLMNHFCEMTEAKLEGLHKRTQLNRILTSTRQELMNDLNLCPNWYKLNHVAHIVDLDWERTFPNSVHLEALLFRDVRPDINYTYQLMGEGSMGMAGGVLSQVVLNTLCKSNTTVLLVAKSSDILACALAAYIMYEENYNLSLTETECLLKYYQMDFDIPWHFHHVFCSLLCNLSPIGLVLLFYPVIAVS